MCFVREIVRNFKKLILTCSIGKYEKHNYRKGDFLFYLALFDELLLHLGGRNDKNSDIFPFRTEILFL